MGMTSEATAKLISESGLAATELAPFAASAAIGDAATLRARIEGLERVPALAEFARAAIEAMDGSATPSGAEHVGRSLENLQAAATALLRHLHRCDALQGIGSRHAVWVRLATQVPLSQFADRVSRVCKALETLATLPSVGGTVTLEAVDAGPFALKIGVGSRLAYELIASVVRRAHAIRERLQHTRKSDHASADTGETFQASADCAAAEIASAHFGSGLGAEEIRDIEDAVVELVGLLGEGVDVYPTLQAHETVRQLFPRLASPE